MDLEERITKLMATLAQVTQDLEELRKDVRSSRPKPSSSGKQSQLSSALNTPTADLSKPGSSSTKPIETEPSIKTEPLSPKPDLSSKIMKATTTPKAPSAALTHSSTTSATSSKSLTDAQKEEVDEVAGLVKKRKTTLVDTTESEARNKKPKPDIQEDESAKEKRPELRLGEWGLRTLSASERARWPANHIVGHLGERGLPPLSASDRARWPAGYIVGRLGDRPRNGRR
jgi:hypothetical protein